MELLVNYYIKIYFLCYNIIRRVGEFMYQIALLFMNFMLFSLFGYIAEMTMCIIVDHKITNRGFLCGPIIPIYGVGSLFLTFLLEPFKSNPFIIFFFGIIITTTLEYITSYLLEITSRRTVGDDIFYLDNFTKYTKRIKENSEYNIKYPSSKKITPELNEYINNDLSNIEKILYSYDYNDENLGYMKYIDVDSFVNYVVFNEFFQSWHFGI